MERAKAKKGGLETTDEEDNQEGEAGGKTKTKKSKEIMKPNLGDIRDVIKKSRNAKSRINYEHKTRIFAEDKEIGVR